MHGTPAYCFPAMQLRIQTEPEMNISPLRLLVNRTIRTLCPALLMLPVACSESGLTIRVIDPLTNVLPGIVYPPAGDDTVRVARGENAVLQFVISADDSAAPFPRMPEYVHSETDRLPLFSLGYWYNNSTLHV